MYDVKFYSESRIKKEKILYDLRFQRVHVNISSSENRTDLRHSITSRIPKATLRVFANSRTFGARVGRAVAGGWENATGQEIVRCTLARIIDIEPRDHWPVLKLLDQWGVSLSI